MLSEVFILKIFVVMLCFFVGNYVDVVFIFVGIVDVLLKFIRVCINVRLDYVLVSVWFIVVRF